MLLEVVRAGEALPAVLALESLGVAAVNSLVGSQIAYSREFLAAERMATGVRLFTCASCVHARGGGSYAVKDVFMGGAKPGSNRSVQNGVERFLTGLVRITFIDKQALPCVEK